MSKSVFIRFRESDYEALTAAASEAGYSEVASFCRHTLLAAVRRPTLYEMTRANLAATLALSHKLRTLYGAEVDEKDLEQIWDGNPNLGRQLADMEIANITRGMDESKGT